MFSINGKEKRSIESTIEHKHSYDKFEHEDSTNFHHFVSSEMYTNYPIGVGINSFGM